MCAGLTYEQARAARRGAGGAAADGGGSLKRSRTHAAMAAEEEMVRTTTAECYASMSTTFPSSINLFAGSKARHAIPGSESGDSNCAAGAGAAAKKGKKAGGAAKVKAGGGGEGEKKRGPGRPRKKAKTDAADERNTANEAKAADAEDGDPHYFVDQISEMKVEAFDRLWKVHFLASNDQKQKGGEGGGGGGSNQKDNLWSWEPLESFTTSQGITEQLVLFEETRTQLSNTLDDDWEYVPGVPGTVTTEADGFVVYHCRDNETLKEVAAHQSVLPKDVFEQNVMRFGVAHLKMLARLKEYTQLRLPMSLEAARTVARHKMAAESAADAANISSCVGSGAAVANGAAAVTDGGFVPLPTTVFHSANTTIITTDIPTPTPMQPMAIPHAGIVAALAAPTKSIAESIAAVERIPKSENTL